MLISAIVYPIEGHWSWGGGWLSEMGFHDFAGSTVVHLCGGVLALAGAIVTGGIGLLAGTIGSRDTQITCLKCGNKFKAGEARVVRLNEKVSDEESQIIRITQSQGKLVAVKWYKDKHNCGLKEAKDTVDSIVAKHNITPGGSGCSIIVLIGISITLGAMFLL